MYMYMYIYIYIYTHIHTYIYIYILFGTRRDLLRGTEAEERAQRRACSAEAAGLPSHVQLLLVVLLCV